MSAVIYHVTDVECPATVAATGLEVTDSGARHNRVAEAGGREMQPVTYVPDVERAEADEAELIERIGDMMVDLAQKVRSKHGVAMTGTHAKAFGYLEGELLVAENLPVELAQGLFKEPGRRFETLVRYASGPPEPLSDEASGQRGMAIKVLGVDGPHLPESRETTTQDFVLGADPAFMASTASSFEKIFRAGAAKSTALAVYVRTQDFRQADRDAPAAEPRSLAEVPD